MDQDIFNSIKADILAKFAAVGIEVEELEETIKVAEETGNLTKIANDLLRNIPNILFSLPIALSLGAGAIGGGILYAGDKHLKNQDERLNEKEQEIHRMKTITNKLKQDYGIGQ